jgi:hypothetical protein
MATECAVDDERRQLTIVASGAVTATEILAHIQYQLAANAWSYALLYDGSLVTSLPEAHEIMDALAFVRKTSERLGPRGPVAIVSRTPQTIEIARRYAFSDPHDNPVGFFLDRASAEQWLEHARAARRI